ncbi:hypothetical protein IV203_013258 [Nitzschia inconspicua]|uniref:Uncharacterized protein n=1 Tax=Nitzschia inconspicua TaxID=303405 RepID=A0A9K3M5N7_9STRA|nr:hypothetical protein IV203_013258 [Nitzschia inconspicua]
MMLNSLEGAMRYIGFHSVQFSNFEDHSSMWMIYNDVGIEYLVQSVMEKNDKEPQLYKIGFKHRHPKMCFLRHLLVYVHCSSHRVGCLYPNQVCHYNEATTLPVDAGNPSLSDNHPVTYTDCLGWIKTRLKNDCRNTLNGTYKFATHSLCATFCLFAALGGSEDFGELMRNARHKHEPTARKYYEDAKIIRDEVKCNATLAAAQDIWPFESRLLQRAGANLERLQRFDPAHLSVSTLADAARVFVEDMLGVTSSNPNYRTPSYLLERSYNKDTKNLLSAFHICLNASIAASNSPINHQIPPPSNPTPTTSPQHRGAGVRDRVTREMNSMPLRDKNMSPPPATADTMNLGRPTIEILSTNNTAPPHFPAPAFQTTSRTSCSLLEFPALCGDAAEDLNTVTLQMVVFDPVSSEKAVNRKYYRLADRCLDAITHLKGEIVIRALFHFVVEIAKLDIMEATKQKSPRPGEAGLYDVAECFDFGRPHLLDTDTFKAAAFEGCPNCTSED